MKEFEIVIASHNMHKIREFKAMLKGFLNLDIRSLADFPEYVAPEENGKTFEENAIVKAVHAAKTLQRFVLADDSGLTVPALKGAPGIFSARYAGNQATDFENRKKLLSEMASLVDEERNAYYECCIALASPDGLIKTATGICVGTIAIQDKGGSGFGYDPIFIKDSYHKSFSELGDEIKNRISHRRKSLDKLIPTIESLLVLPA
ncbi:MAG TPA: RdgB/HAM1 family non-canonical purine NTP pyrophosphatase [Chlamydiales bacterium]|nr:RdgB/HAM1 family non-canonical purine NTP pyrophosphatase [Chlamydiales bacterium]